MICLKGIGIKMERIIVIVTEQLFSLPTAVVNICEEILLEVDNVTQSLEAKQNGWI